MKTGRSLEELAAEIVRQQNAKRDFVASTKNMEMIVHEHDGEKIARPRLSFGDNDVAINDLAHDQIGEHLKIPSKYYDKMRFEAPTLLANNVNEWFKKYPADRMVRTMDDRARAFLSSKYRPLENGDLAEAVLPTLLDAKLDIVSCEITEKRLYIKAVDPSIQRDIPKGAKMGDGSHHIFDTLCPAITIGNSEVGFGSLYVECGTLTRACTNLAFFSQRGLKKYHIGGKHEIGEELYRLLSDETRKATDKAVWMQIRDTVKNAFDEARFDALCEEIKGAAVQPIDNVIRTVELTSRRFGINETSQNSILQHLIKGADLSRYGLSNAITRAAEDMANYDDATQFEKLGGTILELPQSEWKELVAA